MASIKENIMEKQLYKLFNIEVKEADDKERIITAIGSKQIIDRDRDVVDVKGIDTKQYKANPVVLWSHGYSDLPIGKGVGKKVWVDGDELKFKIQFAPEEISPKAGFIYNLYKEGYLHSFSISFLPDYKEIDYIEETTKMPAHRLIKKSELLEISAVNVPANSAAVMAMANKSWEAGVIDGSDLQSIEEWCETAKELADEENKVWIYDEKDWSYLMHHMHENPKNVLDIEELHHCDLYTEKDKKGDVYTQKHIKNGKKYLHAVDTDDVASIPKVLYGHLGNAFKIVKKTIDDEKYAVLTGIEDKSVEQKIEDREELEIKIAQLELELSEKKLDEETDDKSYLDELYGEYMSDINKDNQNDLEELLEEYL